jgi:hypothetical protein
LDYVGDFLRRHLRAENFAIVDRFLPDFTGYRVFNFAAGARRSFSRKDAARRNPNQRSADSLVRVFLSKRNLADKAARAPGKSSQNATAKIANVVGPAIGAKVAVGFIPRTTGQKVIRRGATVDDVAAIPVSSVAMRRISTLTRPSVG